jgi:hypothetical protein
MFRFIIYSVILFITCFIGIYALSSSSSLVSIETLNFSIQTNVPFLLVVMLSLGIVFSFLLFCIYWFTSVFTRLQRSRNDSVYKRTVNAIFDLFCDLDIENENKKRMKTFDLQKTQKIINHPVVELLDYKISAYVQDKEEHSRSLARIKNNRVVGALFYKEMILSKIDEDKYEDAKVLLLEFMQNQDVRPIWFYKTAICIFAHFGDIVRGKDIITKAKKAGAIENYAFEMSNLYFNKAKIIEKEKADKSEYLKFLLEGLEYDNANPDIIEMMFYNISALMGNKKVIEQLKAGWIETPRYRTLEILFYLEPYKDEADLKTKCNDLLKKNNSDDAKIYLAKFTAIKAFYKLSVEILEKVSEKTHNKSYDSVWAFLQIVYLNDNSKEKLEILKQQVL